MDAEIYYSVLFRTARHYEALHSQIYNGMIAYLFIGILINAIWYSVGHSIPYNIALFMFIPGIYLRNKYKERAEEYMKYADKFGRFCIDIKLFGHNDITKEILTRLENECPQVPQWIIQEYASAPVVPRAPFGMMTVHTDTAKEGVVSNDVV